MAYDKKTREQVMKYIGKGHTMEEAREVFGVGTTTIKGWKKLLKETGGLDKRPLNRKHKKIDPVLLKAYVDEHPDSYLREIAELFQCSEVSVFTALRRHKITRKKNRVICGK